LQETDSSLRRNTSICIPTKNSQVDLTEILTRFLANAAATRERLVTPQPNGRFTPQDYSDILFEQPMEDWGTLIRINLSAVHFICVAFMPLLAANPHQGRASIVTIGSISGTTTLIQTGKYAYNVRET
jgi:NAD(P)-dependent dehydrogenase (short-subunit alcohol dehydrogenase family)